VLEADDASAVRHNLARTTIGEGQMHPTDPVNRLMTEPVLTVDINDPAGEVLRLFGGYPVHHLPVLDGPKVVGMLSSADVMKLELFLPKGGNSPIEYLNQRMKVGALLRRPALTVSPTQSVESAAEIMARNGVHALAVVDGDHHLLGILTTTDIMSAALRAGGDEPGIAGAPALSGGSERAMLSPRQLEQALAKATAIAGTVADPDSVNQALVFLNARVNRLEQLRQLASRYLNAGQDERLHAALKKALSEPDGYV
jgi:CBS domain-containing protein